MRSILTIGLSLSLVLFVYLLHVRFGLLVDPPPWPDEAIYTDIALNIRDSISQGSNLWQDYLPQAKTFALWYPRSYFWLLSFWFKLNSPSLPNLRVLSVISGGLVLTLTYLISHKLIGKVFIPFFITLALSLDYAFIRAARLGRPEILCLVFILAAVFLLIRSQKSSIWPLVSGVFIGLSTLIHPLTLISTLISLPLVKRRSAFIRFWLGFTIVISAFILLSLSLLSTLFLQFQAVYQRKTFELPWLTLVFTQEPLIHRLIYLLYLTLTLIFLILTFKKRQFTYFTILTALLAGWLQSLIGRMIWYSVAFIPFLYLATGLLINQKNKIFKAIMLAFTIILISLNLNFSVNQTQIRHRQYTQLGEIFQAITKLIPTGSRVLLSSVPDPYFALRDLGYSLREFPSLAIAPERYQALLDDTDYVVFSENLTPELFGNLLPEYMDKHNDWAKTISNGQGFTLYVVKLKP